MGVSILHGWISHRSVIKGLVACVHQSLSRPLARSLLGRSNSTSLVCMSLIEHPWNYGQGLSLWKQEWPQLKPKP